MTPESERAGFVRKVLENPACDTTRLVFADWLQEHGESERAAFIRSQIAHPSATDTVNSNWTEGRDLPSWIRADAAEMQRLFGPPGYWRLTYRRGFACEGFFGCRRLWKCANILFSTHPLVKVYTDVSITIWGAPGKPGYTVGDLDHVPQPYRNRLAGQPTDVAAISTYHALCIAGGREIAGLPTL